MTMEIRSIIAGALFGLAVLLVIYGLRRVLGEGRDAAERRRGLQAIAGALAALAGSAYLIAGAGG